MDLGDLPPDRFSPSTYWLYAARDQTGAFGHPRAISRTYSLCPLTHPLADPDPYQHPFSQALGDKATMEVSHR